MLRSISKMQFVKLEKYKYTQTYFVFIIDGAAHCDILG